MIIIRKLLTALFCFLLLLNTVGLIPSRAATPESKVGAVTTQGGRLNVRKAADSRSAVLATLKKGSYITLISKSGKWWQVEYDNGKFGYCHSDYITPVEGTPMRVSTNGDILNVRSGPGTSYSRIAKLPHGQIVLLRSADNGWSRILYNGTQLGYVSSRYLSSAENNDIYSAISLAVPSYKQTDSRWASYPIGTTGGTIGKIGCVTTGIAMLESYRTGTTIYPDEMAKKLSYSAGGAVYWPNWYFVYHDYSLQHIYNLLQQGKPVLLGAKLSSGRQHWVVVTGFKGGSSLTADSFTIHDPGSNSRTNLQQFFNVFPNFYKYFHY